MSPFDFSCPSQTKHERPPQQTPWFNGLVTPTNHRGAINVVGREQGRIDTAKQQLTRGAAR